MCGNGLFGGCEWLIWILIAVFVIMNLCDDNCETQGCIIPRNNNNDCGCGCCN